MWGVIQVGSEPHPVSSSGPDRPKYPNVREDIGEDPARYLCRDEPWVAKARIRGIRLLETIAAWRGVERNLARREGREPRLWVIDALDERESHLREHGEFDPPVEGWDLDLGPYPPEIWEDRSAGSLPPITPHEENIADPATDGGGSS